MSGDHDISLQEFVYTFRAEVEPFYERIHPSGANIIHEYMSDMFEAAADGNAVEVKRLVGNVNRKLRWERLWRVRIWVESAAYRCSRPRITTWLNPKLAEIGLPSLPSQELLNG
jgi:hypothetical protein